MKLFLMLAVLAVTIVLSSTFSVKSSQTSPAKSEQTHGPKEPASVTINFDGMIGLFFGDSTRVAAGVLNAHGHTPLIQIFRLTPTGKVLLREFEDSELDQAIDFSLPENSQSPTRYFSAEAWKDPNDSRWLVDMNDLYNRRLTIKESALKTKIRFNGGLWYAGKLSEFPAKFFAANGDGRTLPFKRKTAQAAVKFFLSEGEKLLISGSGFPDTVELTATNQYEIRITNLPSKDMIGGGDHFLHYYDIIAEPLDKYIPTYLAPAAAPFPRICDILTFSQESLQ